MKKKRWQKVWLIVAGILFGIGLASCEKEDPTVAKILVVDTAGEPVSNASVRLYGTSTTSPPRSPIIDSTIYTNGMGYATIDYSNSFNLGQAGVFVLNIDVQKDLLLGTGIIKVEQEKTNEEKVIVQ